MHRKLRIVADTNIIISAMFWSGFPNALLRKCVEGKAELLLSREILDELKEVLRKEKKFGVTLADISEIVAQLKECAKFVRPVKKINVVGDKNDNKILECGKAGNAEYVVSGDRHLLELKRYAKMKIVRAREMVEIIESYC